MPWGKNKSYSFNQSSNKEKKSSVQGTSYTKKLNPDCKNCPHKPQQISASQESKTGKLSRIL